MIGIERTERELKVTGCPTWFSGRHGMACGLSGSACWTYELGKSKEWEVSEIRKEDLWNLAEMRAGRAGKMP